MTRFSEITKELIAKRAGYRCSFPGCGKTLIGPGATKIDTLNIGECAHIFSSSNIGPRTSGGLSNDELIRVENGIYLCRIHHKIVDRNSKSSKYTSDILTRMKSRHELFISAEIGEYTFPIDWISFITIKTELLSNVGVTLNLGKVTFINGDNASGKSVFVEVLYMVLTRHILKRWEDVEERVEALVKIDNPVLSKLKTKIENGIISYEIHKKKTAFNPYSYEVIFLRDRFKIYADDLKTIANCLHIERTYLKEVLDTIDFKNTVRTKSIKVKSIRTNPYLIDEVFVDIGHGKLRSFRSLSYTEQSSVILDIVISLASEMSKFKPTILLIDWEPLFSFDDSNIQQYLDKLQNPTTHFQSVFVSPNKRLKVIWTGWMHANFQLKNSNTVINQVQK